MGLDEYESSKQHLRGFQPSLLFDDYIHHNRDSNKQAPNSQRQADAEIRLSFINGAEGL
jgi:hypothetical protein